MVLTDFDEDKGRAQLVVRANKSMSWAGNVRLVVVLGVIGFSIATGFALQGLWLVFPFVGLEILAVSAGLYCCLLRLERQEVITITSDDVVLERGSREPQMRVSASRLATEVDFVGPPNEFSTGVLTLNMRGQRHRVGDCLGRDEKRQLANCLQRIMRR